MKKRPQLLPPMAAIRAFEAAARYEHFTKAGDELFMSQAAVSYQVKCLEERLGTKLFLKEGRGVKLTDAGRALAEEVCGAFDRLRAGFNQASLEQGRQLNIGCLSSFGYTWLQPRLGEFQAAHPELSVKLSLIHDQSEAFSDKFDIGIHSQYFEAPFRTSVPLLSGRETALCSPAFAAVAKIKVPADLLRQPLLGDASFWKDWFAAAEVDAADLNPVLLNFAVGNLFLEVGAAVGSMGVAIAPVDLYQNLVADGQLVQLFDIYSCIDRRYWLTCSKSQLEVPKIRAFRSWILDQAKPHLAS